MTAQKQPWTICPDCGIGPGADHKRGCPRSFRPPIANHAKPPTRKPTRVVKRRQKKR